MAVAFWLLVGFATVSCVFMAWSLGANSNSPPFAPAIGANAIPTMRAALLIGVFAAAGALTQGGAISETVGSHLVEGVSITPLAAATGLLVAASFMYVGVSTGYPVPAAFATTGAMVGVGLSLGGAPAYDTYRRIGAFWLLVPPTSGGIAYVTARLLRRDDVPDRKAIPALAGVTAAILANVRLGVIPHPTREQGSMAEAAATAFGGPSVAGVEAGAVAATLALGAVGYLYVRDRMKDSVEKGTRTFLVVLGSVVAFSSGGSQVGLATGPLENLYGVQLGLPSIALLGLGAGGMLVGAWMGAPRLLQATSREYAQLGVRRSIAALVPGFVIAQLAIALGIPISFNNIVISGVIGGGLAAGKAGVSRRKIAVTVGFWLVTLATSVAAGFGLYRAASTLLGVE